MAPLERRNPYLEAALDYRSRGWTVIDLDLGTKNPGRQGWLKERYDEEALKARLARPRNLSVLLGETSSGLVDVDLDCSEARMLAAAFLPETSSVFGRPSSPRSHRLYVTDPVAKYKQYVDPEEPDEDRAMLMELRSGGQHTIFPPSQHPSGQVIAWERDGEPTVVAGDNLTTRLGVLAAASLLARYWNKVGQRHEQSKALCGGLIRGGWSSDETVAFVREVAKAADDEEWADRGKGALGTEK